MDSRIAQLGRQLTPAFYECHAAPLVTPSLSETGFGRHEFTSDLGIGCTSDKTSVPSSCSSAVAPRAHRRATSDARRLSGATIGAD